MQPNMPPRVKMSQSTSARVGEMFSRKQSSLSQHDQKSDPKRYGICAKFIILEKESCACSNINGN